MAYFNRRRFLQAGAAGFLGASGALAGLGQTGAFANTTGGYKAMIGIMLKGGVDMFDAVLPRDTACYNALLEQRPGIMNGHEGSRDPDNQIHLDPLNQSKFGTRRFGLAPELAPVGDLFAAGEMAIVGGVGPLLEYTDRPAMDAKRSRLPANLFSHNDQQSTWMALGPEGKRLGWGGAMLDRALTGNAPSRPEFTTITAGGADVFLASGSSRIFRAPATPDGLDVPLVGSSWLTSGNHGEAARQRLDEWLRDPNKSSDNMFARDVMRSQAAGLQTMRDYSDIFRAQTPLTTEFPTHKFGQQMRAIANSIHMRGAIGNNRQMFYADQGGFDTHDTQSEKILGPLAQVFEGIAALRAALIETGAWDDVVIFTMSDFGRTLNENGDGTDHGWGSHHFVFGGQVQGNRIYGEMPELDVSADHFTKTRARLIPQVAVEEYAATLGTWFGLDSDAIDQTLPNLSRFNTRNMGFLGGGTA